MEFESNKRRKCIKDTNFETFSPTLNSKVNYVKALLLIKILYNKVKKFNFSISEDRSAVNQKIQIVYTVTGTKTLYLIIEFTIIENDTIELNRIDLYIDSKFDNKLIKTFDFMNCNKTSKKMLSKIIMAHF